MRRREGLIAAGIFPLLLLLLLAVRVPAAFSFSSGEGATTVLGQLDFTSATAATSAPGLHGPFAMAFDSSGNFWVGDYFNNRVLEYHGSGGLTTHEYASLVIGQSGFGASAPGTKASRENGPTGVAFDSSGNLWVSEINNNRVVMYPKGSGFTNGENATIVIGQPMFTTSGPAATATGLFGPEAIAMDSSGNLWVADFGNNRVLEYLKGAGFTSGQAAALVLGQPDFTTSTSATSATGLFGPSGLVFDSAGNLWVTDWNNNRVLEFLKGSGFVTNEAASLVLGETDFVSSGSGTSQTAFSGPIGITFDGSGNLWVGDTVNNRVVEFLKGNGFTTGQSAHVVIGQKDFTSNGAATTAEGFSVPQGVIFDALGNLWVSDVGNNRILGFASSLQGAASTTTSVQSVTATVTSITTATTNLTSTATATVTSVSTIIPSASVVTSTEVSTNTQSVTATVSTTVTSVSTSTQQMTVIGTTEIGIGLGGLIIGVFLGLLIRRR